MSNKPKINKVSDKMNKHYTYLELNKRKNESFENQDYLSVIHYCYAMIEDRLLSFLHYLYIINRDTYPYKFEKDVEKAFTYLLYQDKEKEKSSPHFNNLNTKINLIKKIYNYKKNDSIILRVKQHMANVLSINDLKKDITKLEEWAKYRNEFTHSMYNKDISAIDKSLILSAKNGLYLSERFDLYSDLLKGNIYEIPSLRSQLENNKKSIKMK